MSILALDLASHRTGFAYWDGYGAEPADHKIKAGGWELGAGSLFNRLHVLHERLSAWLAEGLPALLAIESPDLMTRGTPTNPGTLRSLYAALGVCLAVARTQAVPALVVDARDVRERLVGQATAPKRDVLIILARRGYRVPTLPASGRRKERPDDDAADAMALLLVTMDEMAMAERCGQALSERMGESAG